MCEFIVKSFYIIFVEIEYMVDRLIFVLYFFLFLLCIYK